MIPGGRGKKSRFEGTGWRGGTSYRICDPLASTCHGATQNCTTTLLLFCSAEFSFYGDAPFMIPCKGNLHCFTPAEWTVGVFPVMD